MALGGVIEHEAEFVKGFDGREVGVVDDGDDGPAPAVTVPSRHWMGVVLLMRLEGKI